ncbi:MAG: DUF262 domain-containing protein [Phormidium sp.]
MDLQPFYQRRLRWDEKKQSRLIESFLINIPVPPIILFEKEYNFYEVMDGQQRITAIRDFYENKLRLTGLELWSELNGRTYYERFVENLISDWLRLLPDLVSDYSNLGETILNTHCQGIGRLLLERNKNRFQHLSVEKSDRTDVWVLLFCISFR